MPQEYSPQQMITAESVPLPQRTSETQAEDVPKPELVTSVPGAIEAAGSVSVSQVLEVAPISSVPGFEHSPNEDKPEPTKSPDFVGGTSLLRSGFIQVGQNRFVPREVKRPPQS